MIFQQEHSHRTHTEVFPWERRQYVTQVVRQGRKSQTSTTDLNVLHNVDDQADNFDLTVVFTRRYQSATVLGGSEARVCVQGDDNYDMVKGVLADCQFVLYSRHLSVFLPTVIVYLHKHRVACQGEPG